MGLVRLELSRHDDTLVKQIRQPGHDARGEHVDFEEEAVANVEAVERHSLGKGDTGDIFGPVTVDVLPVAHRQGMVDGQMKAVDVCANYGGTSVAVRVKIQSRSLGSPSAGSKLPVYSMYRYGKAP